MVESFLRFLEITLQWLLASAWQAGVLAIVVFALTSLLGNWLQPRWRFALWLVVFARLALPMMPGAPWSMYQVVRLAAKATAGKQPDFAVRRDSPIRNANDARADVPVAPSVEAASIAVPLVAITGDLSSRNAPPPEPVLTLWTLAALVWLAGFCMLGLRLVRCTLQLHRQARQWRPVRDPAVLTILEGCRRELQLHGTIRLFMSAEPIGPATCGVIRPRIVLPARLVDSLSPGELRLILLHELAHVRRYDALIDGLVSLITAVHWFHPVGWLARYWLRRERELACDAAVLERIQPQAAGDYGRTILKTIESLGRPMPLPGLVGMFGGGRFSLLTRRIRRIAAHRPTTRLGFAAGLLVLVILALVGLTDAQTKAPARKATEKPASSIDKPATATKTGAEESKDDSVYEVPITVFGLAHDPLGRPLAGAEIYLASAQPGYRRLAETKTASDGTYRFDKILLPIKRADTNNGHDVGGFEVFGIANGYALAWRPQKWFFPDRKEYRENVVGDQPAGYGTEDPIELDLKFATPTTIRGRIVNDLGEPIPMTKLAIRYADPEWDRADLNTFTHRGALNSLNEQAVVPPRIKTRVTADDGRFEFTGLPADHRWWIDVNPPGNPMRKIHVVTHDGIEADAKGNRVYSGDFEVIFPRPRLVKLRVVYGDTGKPAAKVGVGGGVSGAGFWETTDDDGFIETPLPDGKCQGSLLPRIGTAYLRTNFEHVVSEESVKEPPTITLRPAAVVEITVVDADTREPLAGADVWSEEPVAGSPRTYRRVHGYRSWEVETRISHYEAPRSDKDGKMRVLFEPGQQRVGVGLEAYPKGYAPIETDGKLLVCQPGAPTIVEFQMRKKEATETQQPKAPPAKAPPKVPPAKGVTDRRADSAPGRVLPTTIGGRARDESGLPVPGATIYLIMRVGWSEKLLGEAFTGPDGRYEFRDAPLQAPEKEGDSWEQAWFRLAGFAPGRAIAWRGYKHVFFDRLEAMRAGMGGGARPDPRLTSYMPGEKIELDLTFPPPKAVAGRLIDEAGRPVADATVSMGQWFFVDAAGKPMNEHEAFRPDGAWLRTLAKLVEEQLKTKSDADGKFEFPSMPPGVVCDLTIKQPNYPWTWLYTSTADAPPATHQNRPVIKQPLEVKLRSVRTVPLLVTLGDTGAPVADVSVSANEITATERSNGGVFDGRSSDKEGKLTLKLPPGEYNLRASPPLDINYIRTEQDVTVDESADQRPVTLPLKRGCFLILKAVDADTGAPIPGIYFRSKEKFHLGWMEVSAPPTDEQGEARAVAVPGSGRYINGGEMPRGYEAVDPQEFHFDGRLIELPEGETVTAVFKFRKR